MFKMFISVCVKLLIVIVAVYGLFSLIITFVYELIPSDFVLAYLVAFSVGNKSSSLPTMWVPHLALSGGIYPAVNLAMLTVKENLWASQFKFGMVVRHEDLLCILLKK